MALHSPTANGIEWGCWRNRLKKRQALRAWPLVSDSASRTSTLGRSLFTANTWRLYHVPVSADWSIDLSRPVAECRPYSEGLYPLVTPLHSLLMGQTNYNPMVVGGTSFLEEEQSYQPWWFTSQVQPESVVSGVTKTVLGLIYVSEDSLRSRLSSKVLPVILEVQLR